MKKSELKELIREVIKENLFTDRNPNEKQWFDGGPPQVWDKLDNVKKLKDSLNHSLDAGNFQQAHKIVDELSNYHN